MTSTLLYPLVASDVIIVVIIVNVNDVRATRVDGWVVVIGVEVGWVGSLLKLGVEEAATMTEAEAGSRVEWRVGVRREGRVGLEVWVEVGIEVGVGTASALVPPRMTIVSVRAVRMCVVTVVTSIAS